VVFLVVADVSLVLAVVFLVLADVTLVLAVVTLVVAVNILVLADVTLVVGDLAVVTHVFVFGLYFFVLLLLLCFLVA